jgi:RimJ/RimL family protein N-acetyltransferase
MTDAVHTLIRALAKPFLGAGYFATMILASNKPSNRVFMNNGFTLSRRNGVGIGIKHDMNIFERYDGEK